MVANDQLSDLNQMLGMFLKIFIKSNFILLYIIYTFFFFRLRAKAMTAI